MRLDLQRNRALAGPEDLDELAASYGALRREHVRVDLAAVREQRREPVQVDDLVGHLGRVLEPLELRHPHVERHLAALERRGHLVARLGALGAAAGGLALRTLAPTDAGLRLVRAGSRPQVMDLEGHSYSTSSTDTRCWTVLTIPRISGRSSLTTTSRRRLRPSVRSVSRWLCVPPIGDRLWVIFRRGMLRPPPRRAAPSRRAPAAWPPARRPRSAGPGGR